ncbi:helix-turn-helix domain-containing protein [Streptomyces sp. MSC1_001]|jgi:transcriptional regulator with XRE-family HTH domain|uniref:helix-turn-helix domain-containing protein n=1 Tax=Streptomyces sp. MSC1_001 TaxID=2909263 RepID=UPI00202E0631|nr:helix-turn-helix transcriptional regulator [Streptomyces sp. MSC1_001]
MITVHNVGTVPTRRFPLPLWVIDQRRGLGDNIVRFRRGAGLSQDQLAERIGKERRSIQRYERAERDPSFSDLVLIANALGVTVADLVEEPPAGS